MQISSEGAPPEYTVNTSVVLVLFGYSKGARKVYGKCIKSTPQYSEGVFKVPGCQSLPVIVLHGLPPVDKRSFWLNCTCLNRSCPVLSWQPTWLFTWALSRLWPVRNLITTTCWHRSKKWRLSLSVISPRAALTRVFYSWKVTLLSCCLP